MATKEDADVDLPASPHNQELLKKVQALWNAHAATGVAGVPPQIRDLLNSAFAKIPVSTFPAPPVGHVIEIPSTASIGETVTTLSLNNILSAPVRNMDAPETAAWSERYIGMVDFPSVVLWVLDQADLAQAAIAAGTAAATGLGAGALAALAAVAAGLAGPAAIAGLTAAAVGAAIASGMAGMKGTGVQGGAASVLGEDFYRVLLNEEPFKSVKVVEITRKYRWAPFLPLQPDDSMLTVLLLLSKFRMRSVPVIEMGKSEVVNLITQSAVVRGLAQCTGFDWFDVISEHSLLELGLPVMPPDRVVTVGSDRPILHAFQLCREHGVGGVPVVDPADGTLVGNVSVRDVRYLLLKPELFGRRNNLTVQEFINVVHGDTSPANMDVTMAEAPPSSAAPPPEERESDSEATTTAAPVMSASDPSPSTDAPAPSAAVPPPSATAASQSTTLPTLPTADPATGEAGDGSGSSGSDTGMKLITCRVDESLRSVIGKLAVSGVHRVIAVNDAQKVVGVLTLRDIIGCFVTEPPNYFGDFFGEALEEAVGKV